MSDSVTWSSETPATTPFTAAITGLCTNMRRGVGSVRMPSCMHSSRQRSILVKPPASSDCTSAPLENALPAPVMIATQISGSSFTRCHAARRSSFICWFIAFRRSGRLRVRVAMRSLHLERHGLVRHPALLFVGDAACAWPAARW